MDGGVKRCTSGRCGEMWGTARAKTQRDLAESDWGQHEVQVLGVAVAGLMTDTDFHQV